jgi:hypothetical protein
MKGGYYPHTGASCGRKYHHLERYKLDYGCAHGSRWLRLCGFRSKGHPIEDGRGRPVKVINWKMVENPLNWIIVLLMLILAGIAGHLILSWAGIEPSTSSDKSPAQSTGLSTSLPKAA